MNLSTYDFHARQMDPVLGRFWGVDPMSSERVSFSPFNYVQNNPMSRVDPTGMLDQGWFINADGFEEYSTKLNSLQRGQGDNEENGMFDTDVMFTQTAGMPDPKKTPAELAKIEKEKKINWGKVGDGAITTTTGVLAVSGGILSVTTGFGTAFGISLIMTGSGTVGFGLGDMVAGFSGKNTSIPGGLGEAIDKGFGGSGTAGQLIDIGSGGIPKSSLDIGLTGYSFLKSNFAESVFTPNNNILKINNNYILPMDNTKVVRPLVFQ